jgi:2-haloacid dehalogenase
VEAAGGEVPETMPAYPDVEAGLRALAADGHRLAVLTNSARRIAERHLAAAGLLDRFEAVIGADEARVYKPAVDAYESALERLRTEPSGSWLVAAHDWDVIGARGAGLQTAFVDRGGPPPATMQPDARVASLSELVRAARDRGGSRTA